MSARERLYAALKVVAQRQTTVTYGEVAPLGALDMANAAHRAEMRRLLNEVSTIEHTHGRPLLSAVVVRQEDGIPGDGFFTLARELGVYDGRDRLAFFVAELRRVHAAWAAGADVTRGINSGGSL